MPTEVLHIKGQIQNATLEMIRRDNQEVHIYALGDDEFYGKDKIEALCEEANYFGDEDWPEALTSVKNNGNFFISKSWGLCALRKTDENLRRHFKLPQTTFA